MVAKGKAIEMLEGLRNQCAKLREHAIPISPEFIKWKRDVQIALRSLFPTSEEHLREFSSIEFTWIVPAGYEPTEADITTALRNPGGAFRARMQEAEAILHSMTEEIHNFWREDGTSWHPYGGRN